MLIAWKYNFIFIHIYKVAGSSINDALWKYTLSPYESLTTRVLRKLKIRVHSGLFPGHAKAQDIRKILGKEQYEKFFTFAFVRNPWDWQVSLYEYMLQSKNHYQHSLIKEMRNFEEYIEWRVTQDKHLQKEWVTDEKDNIIVDFIGRFENINEDFQEICKYLGINETLPYVNRTVNRKPYWYYYNNKTKEMIYQSFKQDIDLFGYNFED